MKEEKFFETVKESLYDYAPEVPASVYEGVRSQLGNSRSFWKFSWHSMNVYFVGVASIALTALAFGTYDGDSYASSNIMEHSSEARGTFAKVQNHLQYEASNKAVNSEAEFNAYDLNFESLNLDSWLDQSYVVHQPTCAGVINESEINLPSQGYLSSEVIEENLRNDESLIADAETVPALSPLESMTPRLDIPEAWSKNATALDARDIIAQLDSDDDTILLKLKVEKDINK